MSKGLKTTFGIHAIVALVFGLPLLLAPGRFLGIFGWLPIDPLISRLLGGALLAFSWSSFVGYRSSEPGLKKALIQMEVIFTAGGALGLLRHIAVVGYPWYVWLLFLILAAFAVIWFFYLVKQRKITA